MPAAREAPRATTCVFRRLEPLKKGRYQGHGEPLKGLHTGALHNEPVGTSPPQRQLDRVPGVAWIAISRATSSGGHIADVYAERVKQPPFAGFSARRLFFPRYSLLDGIPVLHIKAIPVAHGVSVLAFLHGLRPKAATDMDCSRGQSAFCEGARFHNQPIYLISDHQSRRFVKRKKSNYLAWKEPIFAESLCSEHQLLAHNFPPKAPSPEPTSPSAHRAKRTGRFSLGRTAASPTQSDPLRPSYSARRSDSLLAYSANGTEAPSLARHFPNHQGSNHILGHPPSLAPAKSTIPRQKRATAGNLPANASIVMAEAMPPEPQEPYFALNTDIPSPKQSPSASVRQNHNQGAPESRSVPSSSVPRRNLALIGGLVDIDVGFTSKLNVPVTYSHASLKKPPGSVSPARVGNTNLEESRSIAVANTPSRRRPDVVGVNRREASTIHVHQKPGQILHIKENLPLHISPRKRKADFSDTQPRVKEQPVGQSLEGFSTLSESKGQTVSQNSNQQDDVHQSALSGNSSRHHGGEQQTAGRLRNSNMVWASNTPTPATEVIHQETKGQRENHTKHAQVDDGSGQKSIHVSERAQQPESQINGSKDEWQHGIYVSPPMLEKDAPVVDQAALAADTIVVTAEGHGKPGAQVFDSEAFDAMIYRQSTLRPPRGVSVQVPAQSKTPLGRVSTRDRRQYLAINPAIHFPYNRPDEWHRDKALEIQARGRRKAWFGKVIERRRWLRAKEKAEEDKQKAARAPNRKPARIDPQPWSYNRIVDFGDVPPEELPKDVLQNPAWVKACAWHRENQAKRILRDRVARDAQRKAWDQAERVMEDAKMASKKSREP
ncbi:hypothetical protein Trco_002982 [Trichoderma cornu-damae]|uniref:Uncharacterized protein n=1 Tax=Trichoderma cornu-damae TaxID=654480 RepID=A0A9P8TVJ7_9HYPO|nr:hypothetical protein Trco_002982 [Trichoderma cornu-damae]